MTTTAGPPVFTGDETVTEVAQALQAVDFGGARYADEVPQPLRNTFRAATTLPALHAYAETSDAEDALISTVIYGLLIDLHHLCDLLPPEACTYSDLVERARGCAIPSRPGSPRTLPRSARHRYDGDAVPLAGRSTSERQRLIVDLDKARLAYTVAEGTVYVTIRAAEKYDHLDMHGQRHEGFDPARSCPPIRPVTATTPAT